ncbi:2OG-Fe dioxygenase family protein [Sphingomonas sp. MMS24-J13]|uniref:2OG-Fe dioxygenase family protein n=1 Tax=Sphingomonas sp. MMS24-J13 TaxID=3238686 RepID=UPI00384DC644
MATCETPARNIADALRERGYIHVPAPEFCALLKGSDQDWAAFAASWDHLGPDRFMADGGRYRSRRFAAFEACDQIATRKAHQPHFQSRDYNPLNGDIQRWFDPIAPETVDNPILQDIFRIFTPLFTSLDQRTPTTPWHCEVHQFRIETSPAELGRPTPEGLHRDGVDWVVVMLVNRRNVAEGTTEIGAPDGQPLGRFTLCDQGDAVVLDDRRVRHGVTPIRPIAKGSPAYRDALVITWSAETDRPD